MSNTLRSALALLLAGLMAAGAWAGEAAQATRPFFRVSLAASADKPVAGRLLLFATEATAARAAAGGQVSEVDASPFSPRSTAVAAREVERLPPGGEVWLDADDQAFPSPFSQLPPGDYLVQAVLDTQHDYNYHGRNGGDLVSPVLEVRLPGGEPPVLALDRTLPVPAPWDLPGRALSQTTRKHLAQAREQVQPIDLPSPALSAFHGRPVHMRGWVVLPPGYDASGTATYPTVYQTHGFGGDLRTQAGTAAMVFAAMAEKQLPPMIWVVLDESGPTGTHEFADSVNNGPWGRALTAELIPALEGRYRMDARPGGRFLTGHSSGGWATLWLQTRYPDVFGGTWSTSPDPSDFHDFTGVDLYAPHANVYRRPDGTPRPLVRAKGKVIATYETFARLERVLGPYGGQMASFEWVFSPRGADGRPLPMFDRDTGDVDPAVVAYWGEHYDIARRIKEHWPTLKADLDGKIHLVVGTADTFYLDGAAHRLKAVLDGLGARSDIRFLPGRTHGDLYVQGKDRQGLLKQMAWEMYALARPDAKPRRAAAGP